MDKTEKQKAAHQFIGDYMKFLTTQESVVERMVDRKLVQMEPRICQMVEQYIEKRNNDK